MPLPAASSIDNRGQLIIISEITPRSPNRDLEYRLLSEERNPIHKNPQKKLVYHMVAPPLPPPGQ
jgi:hypothetical protein